MRGAGSRRADRSARLRPVLAMLVGAALPALFLIGSLHLAAAAGALDDEPATRDSTARVSVVVELDAPPLAEVYSALAAGESASAASLAAATQAHLAAVEAAQQALAAQLDALDATVIYRAQRVYNGIALHIAPERLAELAALPGVRALHRLSAKTPAQDAPAAEMPADNANNANAAPWIGAVAAWQGSDRPGLTGAGITIALIDTGIDYLHRDFGGPGSGHDENDPTRIGDTPSFPGPKVIGGYDFVGDSYNADAETDTYQPIPQPDPDPMDCYGIGHGTHVGGSAAGYGVTADGATYSGPYPPPPGTQWRIGPGVAPQAQILALKVFGCHGSSEVVDLAIEWAVDPNRDGDFGDHVNVINLSLGSSFGAPEDTTTVAVENAAKLGIVVVVSAGNSGDLFYAAGSPAIAPHAIAVAGSVIPANGMAGPESLASFSARGPGRNRAALKPDLAAPGMQIVSARRGPGDASASSSGTSMAAGLASGALALLRQAHPAHPVTGPGWLVAELKALAMNTAVPLVSPAGIPYGPLRGGAGRLDLGRALASRIIAYNAAAPEQVSISFGAPEVWDSYQAVAAVQVANKGEVEVGLTVAYSAAVELPGVTFGVGTGGPLTVPAGGFATVPVTLAVEGAALRHLPAPALTPMAGGARSWLAEAGGAILLTPTDAGPTLRVPVYVAPRPVGDLQATPAGLDFGLSTEATATLTLTGLALAGSAPITAAEPLTGATPLSETRPPTRPVALAGLFTLHHRSPPQPDGPDGAFAGDRYAHADLKAVGMAGPIEVEGSGEMIYFAVHTYAPWATPHEVLFHVELDLDGDGTADRLLYNSDRIGWLTGKPGSDEFMAALVEMEPQATPNPAAKLQGPLNLYSAAAYDTRLLNNEVMVLPLRVADLKLNGERRFRYRAVSYSKDVSNAVALGLAIDSTPWIEVNLDEPGILGEAGLPLREARPGDTFTLSFSRAGFATSAKGVMALFLHNSTGRRVQIIPVAFLWPYRSYLPSIAQ